MDSIVVPMEHAEMALVVAVLHNYANPECACGMFEGVLGDIRERLGCSQEVAEKIMGEASNKFVSIVTSGLSETEEEE